MRIHAALSIFALVATAGCTKPAATNTTAENIAVTQAVACASGSATLPVTGLCEEQAAALMFAASGEAPTPPDDCAWILAEAKMPDGALLYRTAQCPTGTARLKFVPGTPMASFEVTESPYPDPSEIGFKMIHLLAAPDGKATVLATARLAIDDKAEAARCQIRPLNMESRPADAFVVDEVPMPSDEELRSSCGTFGYDNSAQEYWRLSQGQAWFFHFGQETPLIIPETVTLVKRDAAGKWVRG
ncbi:MAG: hypothetical protein V4808_00945 [Pseudomonadota bacterium]